MKYSLYLVSALLLISCVSGNDSSRHHHNHHKGDRLDDLTTEILEFGINFLFDIAADRYGVSSDNVEVTKVNSVEKRNLDGPRTLYKFDADATNNNDARIEARFAVEYNHETEEMTMGKWTYDIHYRGIVGEDSEFEGFLNEEEDNSWESAVDEGEAAVEVETATELENEVENETEAEIEIETGVDEEGTDDNNEDFVEVSEEEIENDPVINDVLEAGAAFIFNRASNSFGVSNSSIEITDVESVARRAGEDNKTIYRINIDATNNDDATVNARLTIEHDNETGENVVGPWRYSIQYRTGNNEEGGLLEEEDVLEFAFDDGFVDIL